MEDFIQKYSFIRFNTRGLHKSINPDIRLDFNSNGSLIQNTETEELSPGGWSVKFHTSSLERVVEYENELKNKIKA